MTEARQPQEHGTKVRFAPLRFTIVFAAFVGASMFILGSSLSFHPDGHASNEIVESYFLLLASTSKAIMHFLGVEVRGVGPFLLSSEFATTVGFGCGGLQVLAFLIAAMVAFPASLTKRALGIVLGAALIFALNVVRIVVLNIVGRTSPEAFEYLHVNLFPAILVVLVGVFWLQWLRWPPLLARRR